MIVTQSSPGLEPLDPMVKAKRKRQNRILVALLVMVVVPVAITAGVYQYSLSMMRDWPTGPTVMFNTQTAVHLSKGDYTVWTYAVALPCSVQFNGDRVGTAVESPENEQVGSYYPSVKFSAANTSDYVVDCPSRSTGHAVVSGASPVNRIAIVVVIGILIAGVCFLTGLVLLIVGVANNSSEKAATKRVPRGRPYVGNPPTPHSGYPNQTPPWLSQPPTRYPNQMPFT